MRDIDPIGQLLAVLSLFGLVYVLIEVRHWGGRIRASW